MLDGVHFMTDSTIEMKGKVGKVGKSRTFDCIMVDIVVVHHNLHFIV